MIIPYKGILPKIPSNAFVAPSADIIGDVTLGHEVGVWFGCVLRGDVAPISVGAGTNIQDGTIVHVTRGGHPTIIGAGVTIGHRAMLHACTLQDHVLVGMSATILDDARMESFSMLAAGSVLSPRKVIPSGQLWAGVPATYKRDLTEQETKQIIKSRDNYIQHVYEYLPVGDR